MRVNILTTSVEIAELDALFFILVLYSSLMSQKANEENQATSAIHVHVAIRIALQKF